MTNIKSKRWYDHMCSDVKDILETLGALDAAFIGYVNKDIDGQPVTLSWDKEVVTVTADKFKWQMPIAWFVDEELIDKITEHQPEASESIPTEIYVPEGTNTDAVRAVRAQVPPGDTLVVGGIKVPPGVKSVAEIMAEADKDENYDGDYDGGDD